MRGQLGRTGVQGALRSSSFVSVRHSFALTSRQLRVQQLAQSPRLLQQLRHASSGIKTDVAQVAQAAPHVPTGKSTRSSFRSFKNLIYGTILVISGSFVYLYVSDTRAAFHQYLVPAYIRTFYPDAEDAHHFGNDALKRLYALGLHPRERGDPDAAGDLRVEVFGHILDNPIGTSAGLDKNGEVIDPILAVGPGLVEIGGITPRPQEGNAKPRVWRIPSQNAIINRYGLNSEGAEAVALRLRQRLRKFAHSIGLGTDPEAEHDILDGELGVPPGSHVPGRLLAVQVAKMKETPDGDIDAIAKDYTDAVDKLARYADILVVNVSSPNTPGLRALQASEPLTKILTAVVDAAQATDRKVKPAVMVKVSPDEDSEEQVNGICAAVWASGVDGIIVGNTTKKRPDPLPSGYRLPEREAKLMLEMGGYSGPQLFNRTVSLVKKYRSALDHGPREAQPGKEAASASNSTPSSTTSATEAPTSTTDEHDKSVAERISDSIDRDVKNLKPLPAAAAQPDSDKQPLLQLPDRHTSSSSTSPPPSPSSTSSPTSPPTSPSPTSTSTSTSKLNPTQRTPSQDKDKVIFATGGITTGAQALEVLNAGASVAFVYTAMVYGGAGTVSRIKREMREEISGGRREVGGTRR